MKLPDNFDYTLPYFEYGFFKPSEPASQDIAKFVQDHKEISLKGVLNIADGLPLYDPKEKGSVAKGFLLIFKKEFAEQAYKVINNFMPFSVLQWDTQTIPETEEKFNVLRAKDGIKDYLGRADDAKEWNGKDNPMFFEAMLNISEVVSSEAKNPNPINLDDESAYQKKAVAWKRLFEIQKAYLLLNAVFERFLYFRYGFGNSQGISSQEGAFIESPLFKKALMSATGNAHRTIFDFLFPADRITLNSGKLKHSLKYYRQIRNNLIHRGKVSSEDANITRQSLIEFYLIIKFVLEESYPGLELPKI